MRDSAGIRPDFAESVPPRHRAGAAITVAHRRVSRLGPVSAVSPGCSRDGCLRLECLGGRARSDSYSLPALRQAGASRSALVACSAKNTLMSCSDSKAGRTRGAAVNGGGGFTTVSSRCLHEPISFGSGSGRRLRLRQRSHRLDARESRQRRPKVRPGDLRTTIAEHAGDRGVMFPSATWIIQARRPRSDVAEPFRRPSPSGSRMSSPADHCPRAQGRNRQGQAPPLQPSRRARRGLRRALRGCP